MISNERIKEMVHVNTRFMSDDARNMIVELLEERKYLVSIAEFVENVIAPSWLPSEIRNQRRKVLSDWKKDK